jgi:hypothetical protein
MKTRANISHQQCVGRQQRAKVYSAPPAHCLPFTCVLFYCPEKASPWILWISSTGRRGQPERHVTTPSGVLLLCLSQTPISPHAQGRQCWPKFRCPWWDTSREEVTCPPVQSNGLDYAALVGTWSWTLRGRLKWNGPFRAAIAPASSPLLHC